MLSKAKEKLIRSLHTKKGREKSGKCLVEGQKIIDVAEEYIEFVFHRNDTKHFEDLITTKTPQDVAAVAKIPHWELHQVKEKKTIVVLDGVQDPGNVGAILRLCLAFRAGLFFIESVDVTNPKVIRSSVGALFQVPWIDIARNDAAQVIRDLQRPIFRLERGGEIQNLDVLHSQEPIVIIAGSEGTGIHLPIDGISLEIPHDDALESLNVGHALAIALSHRI